MDGTSRHAGPRTRQGLLARAGTVALVAGLLGGCGTEGGGTDTAQPGADLGYGAPAPASASQSPTDDATAITQPGVTTDEAPDETTDEAAAQAVIVIEGFDYVLPESVPPGAEIVVRNLDGVGHTVTADEGEAFDVVVGPDAEVRFTAPSEAGEYPFHCTPHPAMTGTLVVEGDGS